MNLEQLEKLRGKQVQGNVRKNKKNFPVIGTLTNVKVKFGRVMGEITVGTAPQWFNGDKIIKI